MAALIFLQVPPTPYPRNGVTKSALGDVAEIRVGLPTRIFSVARAGESSSVISVRALTDAGLDPAKLARVEAIGSPEAKYRVREGDLLIPSRSTSLKACVVPGELDGEVFNATVVAIRLSPQLNPWLLRAWLLHPKGRDAIDQVSQSGTRQINITAKALAKLIVPLPPPGMQKTIVSFLEASEEAYASAIAAAEARRRIARQLAFEQMLE